MWDITWIKTDVRGIYYYAYVIEDLFDRSIVGWMFKPRVSDNNPYIESFFKSVKYICGYPSCFQTIDGAGRWFADFIDWYNNSHMHSGLQYVTPVQKRSGQYISIFTERNKIINEAKSAQRARWATCSTLQRTPPPLCLSRIPGRTFFEK